MTRARGGLGHLSERPPLVLASLAGGYGPARLIRHIAKYIACPARTHRPPAKSPGGGSVHIRRRTRSELSNHLSRAAARVLCALSRRFRGCFASPAPLGVHRPSRASGGDPEGVENGQGAEDAVERAKFDRKSPLTRARPRVPVKTRLTYLERRARALDPPPESDGRARSRHRRRRRSARTASPTSRHDPETPPSQVILL